MKACVIEKVDIEIIVLAFDCFSKRNIARRSKERLHNEKKTILIKKWCPWVERDSKRKERKTVSKGNGGGKATSSHEPLEAEKK